MKNILLAILTLTLGFSASAQDDCFKKLEEAFSKRGSYTVADDMHRNVIVSFFTPEGTECLTGKARVENGSVVSVFLQYDDGTYYLLEKKFYNAKKTSPIVTNGISEMIFTVDGEKFRVVFIDKLKPKAKSYKQANLPDDL
ncbi:MAG: hypothetical protein K0S23_3526 [Fluviicola sp.]|jgi:hypothetical protein|uniref:hypothetical protein n=1 Tax=Fluviicola sp. TaxID=1917219 RepID=UPI002603E3FE|nr:hypothetical protein [Fluviicola sp.]MDF3029219.1 hypothetical protein [Fluviicola sp.]